MFSYDGKKIVFPATGIMEEQEIRECFHCGLGGVIWNCHFIHGDLCQESTFK
jgi:hypothetical protein